MQGPLVSFFANAARTRAARVASGPFGADRIESIPGFAISPSGCYGRLMFARRIIIGISGPASA